MEYFTTLYNADIQRYESLSCSVDISLDRWIVSAPRFINWKWWTVLISRSSVPCILYGTYSLKWLSWVTIRCISVPQFSRFRLFLWASNEICVIKIAYNFVRG